MRFRTHTPNPKRVSPFPEPDPCEREQGPQNPRCRLHAGVAQREELGTVGCSAAVIAVNGGTTHERLKGFLRLNTRDRRGRRHSSTIQNSSGVVLRWTRPSCCREMLHSTKRIQGACHFRHPPRELPTSPSTLSTPLRQPAGQLFHIVFTREREQPSLARTVILEFVHANQFTCDGRMAGPCHLPASCCLPAFRGW